MNICTDGNETRRQAYNAIMKYEVSADSSIGKIVHELPLFDTRAGKNQQTVSFDPKHLTKRCWTFLTLNTLISGGVYFRFWDF